MYLWEINEMLEKAINQGFDEETGVIFDEESIEKLEMARADKLEGLSLWWKDQVAQADAIRAEERVLAERRKRLENKAESIKKYIEKNLAGEKFRTAKVEINYRKSESVEISDMSLIPEKFLTFEPKADKTEIKKAIKAGDLILGAEIVAKTNMSIK